MIVSAIAPPRASLAAVLLAVACASGMEAPPPAHEEDAGGEMPPPAAPDARASAVADSGARAPDAGGAPDALPVAIEAGVEAAPLGGDAGGAMVADPGKEGDGNFTINGPYTLPPEATLAAGVMPGTLATVMITTKIFPGRDRTVTVYTPAGYVAGTPAPFMVLQDGPNYINNFKLPVVLDNLIAKKQLPALVGIFIPNGGTNRSFEYDSLTDLYVRFVLEEVLPTVEKSLPVKLTTDPEGRAAGGHSSGGIAAFTMGWHRPDQFRRILTHSGSFTNIRGGNRTPGLIRDSPVKPLRVFLSVGTKDLGGWMGANQDMAAALAAKAYHYRFVLLNDGTHTQSHPASILPETLLWLWRGYPIAGN